MPIVCFGVAADSHPHLVTESLGGSIMAIITPSTPIRAPQKKRTVTHQKFRDEFIGLKALGLSRTRKAQVLLQKYGSGMNRFFDSIPSTEAECIADWMHAVAAVAMEDLVKNPELYSLSAEAFVEFEGLWLEDLRRYAAYHTWLGITCNWHSESTRFTCYSNGCDELRHYLVAENKPKPGPSGAVEYLRQTYLSGADADVRRDNLALQKGYRLLEWGIPQPFETAKKFVDAFYSNIDDAISLGDPAAVTQVLKAVQNGGSQPGFPSIVNGFEALLLLLFLDGALVEALWNDPGSGIVRSATL